MAASPPRQRDDSTGVVRRRRDQDKPKKKETEHPPQPLYKDCLPGIQTFDIRTVRSAYDTIKREDWTEVVRVTNPYTESAVSMLAGTAISNVYLLNKAGIERREIESIQFVIIGDSELSDPVCTGRVFRTGAMAHVRWERGDSRKGLLCINFKVV